MTPNNTTPPNDELSMLDGCPSGQRWRELLAGQCEDADQQVLTMHLDQCPECREHVDQLVGDLGDWFRDQPSVTAVLPMADSALLRVMEAAIAGSSSVGDEHSRGNSAEPPELAFLEPAEEADVFGRLGHYEVLEFIGQGASGIVLKARDLKLGRIVALKVLAPHLANNVQARQRFVREARAAAAIRDDHVIGIFGVEESRGVPFIVMEYIVGRSLDQRLVAGVPLPVAEILRVGSQIARGLSAAHAQGVIHRDIKPANILLENCVERVRITDFGLARAIDDPALTRHDVVLGTPEFMAPEQTVPGKLDGRADLFSLGSLLYLLCTGSSPFRAETTHATLARIREWSPADVRELNAEVPVCLSNVVCKLLAKVPDQRYASAEEVAETLEDYLQRWRQDPGCLSSEATNLLAARTRWRRISALAASVMLLAFVTSESLGVTQLAEAVAIVLRVHTPEGTLVVQVDDPDVKVSVDAEGQIVKISGVGDHEIRLPAGQHRILTTRDGHPVHEQLVSVARNGREVVSITRELNPANPDERVGRIEWRRGDRRPTPQEAFQAEMGKQVVTGEIIRELSPQESFQARKRRYEQAAAALQNAAQAAEEAASRAHPPLPHAPVREFVGHTGPVRDIALSTDGLLLASASGWPQGDRTLRLWDTHSGQLIHTFSGLLGEVFGVAFAGGDQQLVTVSGGVGGGIGGAVVVWNVADGKELRRATIKSGPVCLAVVPGTDNILLGMTTGDVVRWNYQTGAEVARFKCHDKWITSIAALADGQQFVTGSRDQTVRLFDASSGNEVRNFGDLGKRVDCVAVAPDGKSIAVAANIDNSKATDPKQFTPAAVVFDVATGERTHELTGPVYSLNDLCFSSDGQRLLAGGFEFLALEWNLKTKELLRRQRSHTGWLWSVAYHRDGQHFFTAGGGDKGPNNADIPGTDFAIRMWSLKEVAPPAASQSKIDAVHEPVAAVTVRPAELLKQPALKELVDQFLKLADVGLAADEIEQFTLVITPVGIAQRPVGSASAIENAAPIPHIAMVLRMTHPFDFVPLRRHLAPVVSVERFNDHQYLRHTSRPGSPVSDFCFWQPDDRTFVVFQRQAMAHAFLGGQDVAINQLVPPRLRELDSASPIAIVVDMEQLRRQLGARFTDLPPMVRAGELWNVLAPLWEQTRSITVTSQLDQSASVELAANCLDAASATDVRTTLEGLLTLLRGSLRAEAGQGSTRSVAPAPDGPATKPAVDPAPERVLLGQISDLLAKVQISQQDARVVVRLAVPMDTLLGNIVPTVTAQARLAAARTHSTNNLKQLGLALHTYHDKLGHLPAAAIHGKDGQGGPPHSWRVAILPFLGYRELYEKYRFDEPWDSPANRKLVAQMPPLFRSPSDHSDSSHASYFALVGPGTAFADPAGAKIEQFTDGASNTVLLIEARREIPWTQPEDLPYAADKPLPQFGDWSPLTMHVLFADGAVATLSKSLTEETLRAYITRDANDISRTANQ